MPTGGREGFFVPNELGGGYVVVGFRPDFSDGAVYGTTDGGFYPHRDGASDVTGATAAERQAFTHGMQGTEPVTRDELAATARDKVNEALADPGAYDD